MFNHLAKDLYMNDNYQMAVADERYETFMKWVEEEDFTNVKTEHEAKCCRALWLNKYGVDESHVRQDAKGYEYIKSYSSFTEEEPESLDVPYDISLKNIKSLAF